MRVLPFPAVFCLLACSSSQPATTISQKEFPDPLSKTVVSTADWAPGQTITIENDSVDFREGAGGTIIIADPTTRRVTATASFTARADDDDHRDEALQSIADARAAFVIDGFVVKCLHGQSHGTSRSGSAGCKQLKVTIPAGSSAEPLDLHVIDLNGGVSTGGPLIPKSLALEERGLGPVELEVLPPIGSSVVVRAGFDVRVRLPATFAADQITLRGGKGPNDINTTAFPGMSNGKPFGAAGAGAVLFDVSTSEAGSITVLKL